MKSFTFLLSAIFLMVACMQKESKVDINEPAATEMAVEPYSEYDSTLATKYGADDYGMKTYVMAFLKRGPNRPTDSAQSAKLMRAHLDNIGRLAEEGKLIIAGPFYGDGDLRGIYIFDTDNLDTARSYTESDPAIQHGSLEMELLKWYGSAGLMAVPELHSQISKKEI